MKPNLIRLILYKTILSGWKAFFSSDFPDTQNILNLYKVEVTALKR